MTWSGVIEHARLLERALTVIDELDGLRYRLEHRGDIEHAQHGEFADRARGLAGQLRAALILTERDLYGPAFGCLRSALEHVCVDHLVFLGRRVVQTIEGVDEETWADWNRERQDGDDFIDVVEWRRTKKGAVEIIREGLRSKPTEGLPDYYLSPHYFLLREYSPYLGTPGAQAMFDDGITDPERSREAAERNEAVYRTYFSWKSVKRSLQLNEFATETDLSRLQVHYQFLSAFVHPLSHVREILYGRNVFDIPRYDHYSSELALLYIIAFGVSELRRYLDMADQSPEVGVQNRARTERFCADAWDTISYLWFPGHSPHWFDRVSEANKRAFRQLRSTHSRPEVHSPAALPDDGIRYYRDPLRRLVAMHTTSSEMVSGLVFVSPWPRQDAPFR